MRGQITRDIALTHSVCQQTGKVQFLSKGEAKKAKGRMLAKGKNCANDLQVFLCVACGYHHLGTPVTKTRLKERSLHAGSLEDIC